MGILYEQLHKKLLPGMTIPKPIYLLYDWIESQGTYIDRPDGVRFGFLFPENELKESWSDNGRSGGTIIEIVASGNSGLEHWFGHNRADVLNRLCVFAQSGAEGSMVAFWINDEGKQKIVHLGSGSGSMLVCVLASDPVDFLRLLAIGYDEICWNDAFDFPPNHNSQFVVHPNILFQKWVCDTFGTSIPATASSIVEYPCEMIDKNPKDEFAQWVEKNT